ncbi:RNA-directed DNA polymerase [Pseudomonas sp. StFLB209]|uniref:reverse transcriptase family protein n=1 Tax=Pseudomonas sp. StFLB209 TaxID=1028989 RepID=UPI0004F5FD4F|nr:reverse transcriptase family protein [Pseudomonas sp. StFLB209]BAP44744.1 RNA-directed DNA polymerase [Pseudomonas sp. StFLB209]
MDAILYHCRPIYSLKSLALALGESVEFLGWLACQADSLYRPVQLVKKDGTPRYAYDARADLKKVQRKIVDRILARVVYPKYLHGGIKDADFRRSIYSNANLHTGAKSYIVQDISNFFPSISFAKVYDVFSLFFNFGHVVAHLLTRLVTRAGVVPQGASTSSYLANLVFWDVEPEVVLGLKEKGFCYSRFADDITVSSPSALSADEKTEIVTKVTGMLARKGFKQKRSKMHVLKKGQAIALSNGKYEPALITGLSISGPKPVITKKERNRIRGLVKNYQALIDMGRPDSELEKVFHKVMGQVGRIIACGQAEGAELKKTLNEARRLSKKSIFERHDSLINASESSQA